MELTFVFAGFMDEGIWMLRFEGVYKRASLFKRMDILNELDTPARNGTNQEIVQYIYKIILCYECSLLLFQSMIYMRQTDWYQLHLYLNILWCPRKISK